MNVYRHDGTPEGFLTALLRAHADAVSDSDIPATGRATPDLFAVPLEVTSEPTRARGFLEELADRHGPEVPRRLMYLYYSESARAGALARSYLRLREDWGPEADQHLTHPVIREVLPLCRQVSGEIHRFKGLLRFASLEPPALHALMEPDFNILMPVAFYFRRRLGGQPWLITDVKRKRAAHWDGDHLSFMDVEMEDQPGRSTDEMARLWRTFYRSVAIPDRKNEGLRRQHMPERYWKYLSEI